MEQLGLQGDSEKIPQRQNVAISQKCMNIFASNFVYMVKMRLTCFALCFVYSELLQTTHEAEARRFQHSINLNILVPIIFTALHGMQTRSSDENSVCLSVCPSVRLSHAWIVTKRTKDRSRFLYHTKEHLS